MRNVLPEIERILAKEGELVITRRGEPVARLLPLVGAGKRPSHDELRVRMRRAERGSEAYVRQERDER